MQGNTRIILMTTIAAGIGALIIGSSLATAAFAQMWSQQQQTSQSISQTNNCEDAKCSNTATNVAVQQQPHHQPNMW
jgi:predicted phage tail protein